MKVDKDFAEFCVDIAIKAGADYAEVRVEKNFNEQFILKNGVPEISDFLSDSGIGMRVIVNGAMAFLGTDDFNREKAKDRIREIVKNATASSRIVKNKIQLTEEKTYTKDWEIKAQKKITNVSSDEKVKTLIDVDKQLKGLKVKLPSRFFQLMNTTTEKYFVNSEGTRIGSKIPRINLFYSLVAASGNKSEQRYFQLAESGGWELIKKWKLDERIVKEAKTLGQILERAKPLNPRNYDVVLSSELVGIAMHESCGHPAEADRILGREGAQAGEGYIDNSWLNKRIGSDCVTVVDDPTVKGSYGFYEYDDEGVKARRRFLIKDGLINELLHNRETAVKFGLTSSNAASRASEFWKEPLVRMSTTFMLPGNYSFDELVEDVKLGVFINSFTEWNIDDKRWNERYVGSESYLIENGEIKNLVLHPILEITTKSFFSSVDACGKKVDFVSGSCGKGDPQQGVPVWMGGPPIRLRNIYMTSR